jgi:dihydroorotase
MTILVRKAIIKDPSSPLHNQLCDILIKDGLISEISANIEAIADQIINFKNQLVSPGWIDSFTIGTDPGYEHKDTLDSISMSAAKGGYTHILLSPNTKPVVQNKTSIDYIENHSLPRPVEFHPIGAITKNTEGKELTEMFEMQESGAIAFSDGTKPIQSAGLIIKALQYVKAFNGIVIQIPDESSISSNGQMNEGITSTQIGLKGKHKIAETIMVSRDLELAAYTKSRLHITGITTVDSLSLVSNAKNNGADVSCSVTPQHLFFNEDDLRNYDTNLKMNPPLRSEQERVLLLQAVKDGKVDSIASHHTPQHLDMKLCEFEYAGDGMLCLESSFGMLGHLDIPLDIILDMICFKPRTIFNLKSTISIGEKADLTIFNSSEEYTFSKEHIKSKSMNSPLVGKKLKGFVHATILNDKMSII